MNDSSEIVRLKALLDAVEALRHELEAPAPLEPTRTHFQSEPPPDVRALAFDVARDLAYVFGTEPTILVADSDGRYALNVLPRTCESGLDRYRYEGRVEGLTRRLASKYPDCDFEIRVNDATFAPKRHEPERPEFSLHLEDLTPALRRVP